MENVQMLLRVYARCADEKLAKHINEKILFNLTSFHCFSKAQPVKYWKIPDFFKFEIEFPSAYVSASVFQQVLDTTKLSNWIVVEDDANFKSFVWSSAEIEVLFVPEVQWAELMMFEVLPESKGCVPRSK